MRDAYHLEYMHKNMMYDPKNDNADGVYDKSYNNMW